MEPRYVIRKVAVTDPDYSKVLELREVLLSDVTKDREKFNEDDDISDIYLMETAAGVPLATIRVVPHAHGFQFSKLAVARAHQSRGVGQLLFRNMIDRYYPRLSQDQILFGHSKANLVDYYRRSGFIPFGSPFVKWGTMHHEIRYDGNNWNKEL